METRMPRMSLRIPTPTLRRTIVPLLFAASLPMGAALAQAPPERQPQRAPLSEDAVKRLQDGRFAMIKEALKLNDQQLKLWAPVEAEMRSAATARRQMREERIKHREQGQASERLSLPDRLDRASQRLKAFSEVFKPFYASLSEEQKAIADVVLHRRGGGHGRWAMRRDGARQ